MCFILYQFARCVCVQEWIGTKSFFPHFKQYFFPNCTRIVSSPHRPIIYNFFFHSIIWMWFSRTSVKCVHTLKRRVVRIYIERAGHATGKNRDRKELKKLIYSFPISFQASHWMVDDGDECATKSDRHQLSDIILEFLCMLIVGIAHVAMHIYSYGAVG